ncbi:hypothetical protein L873DRAFT_1706522, partial [Choiromyces venosus 120613-1]
EASKKYCTSQSNITINKAMICFMGCSIDICKMPNKLIKIGYKFHYLADHGYVWDFWPQSDTKDRYNSLPPSATQPTPTIAFNLYTDNYYTTLDPLSNLHLIGIGGCRTTRKDWTGYPVALKVPENSQIKVEYYFITGTINWGVTTILWFDNILVSLMTTIHSLVS